MCIYFNWVVFRLVHGINIFKWENIAAFFENVYLAWAEIWNICGVSVSPFVTAQLSPITDEWPGTAKPSSD